MKQHTCRVLVTIISAGELETVAVAVAVAVAGIVLLPGG